MRAPHHQRLAGYGCRMLTCSALVILAACQQGKTPTATQGQSELTWARAALERNPNLEVLAIDERMGVFTVRDRSTGEVQAVKANELAATPVAQLAAPTSAETQASTEAATAAPAEAPATSSTPTAQPTDTPATAANTTQPSSGPREYTIERSDGQVKVSGPGISIVSSGPASAASAQGGAAERPVDPIICEGARRIHLDNRDIHVEGDAVIARDGCEVYITNSRIVASGTGVVAYDAVVHIANSYVEGAAGSFAADGRSRMFLRGSTFNGLSRRDSLASVQDQGGNQWR